MKKSYMKQSYMKQSYILGIFAIFVCLFSLFNLNSQEGIIPQRKRTTRAIAEDNSIDAKTKINMINQIQIGDPQYKTVLYDLSLTPMEKIDKIGKLVKN